VFKVPDPYSFIGNMPVKAYKDYFAQGSRVDRNSNAAARNYDLQQITGGPNTAEDGHPALGCLTGAGSRTMDEMVLQQRGLPLGPQGWRIVN
jgi:hypothetical protein